MLTHAIAMRLDDARGSVARLLAPCRVVERAIEARASAAHVADREQPSAVAVRDPLAVAVEVGDDGIAPAAIASSSDNDVESSAMPTRTPRRARASRERLRIEQSDEPRRGRGADRAATRRRRLSVSRPEPAITSRVSGRRSSTGRRARPGIAGRS